MKKTNFIKKYFIFFLLLFMISMPFCSIQLPETVSASVVQPLSDRIEWRLKKMNGQYYKRLYNYTTGTWIGDWIPIPKP